MAIEAGVYQVGVRRVENYPWQNAASPIDEIITFEILPAQNTLFKGMSVGFYGIRKAAANTSKPRPSI